MPPASDGGDREVEAMRQLLDVLGALPDRETRLRVLCVAAIELRQYGVAAQLLGDLVRLHR